MTLAAKIVLLIAVGFWIPVAKGLMDNTGMEFIIGFMKNGLHHSSDSIYNNSLLLFITTQRASMVNVNVSSPRFGNLSEIFNITAGQVQTIEIEAHYRVQNKGPSSKGIIVSADDEIVVYGENMLYYSNDGFLALPTDVLGNDYFAVTSYPDAQRSEILIVGVNDSTSVNITLPSGTNAADVLYDGSTYIPGSTVNVIIDRCSTFLLLSHGDLTGAHIVSDNKISVFSGNEKTSVRGTSMDHTVEHLTPVNTWGKKFATVPIPYRAVGDVFKFVSSQDDTVISYFCNSSNSYFIESGSIELLLAGQFTDILMPSDYYCCVIADKPILLVQIVVSNSDSGDKSDPSMIIIPPINQYSANYTFTTHKASRGNLYDNFFMFIIKRTEFNDLLLDGSIFPPTDYVIIPGTDYIGGYLKLEEGVYEISHNSASSKYAGFLYGRQYKESYGFPLGMRMENINKECIQSSSVVTFESSIKEECTNSIDVTVYTTISTTTTGHESITVKEQNISINELISDMKIDKENTSNAIRKKLSVYENRTSTVIMGWTAVIVLFSVICVLTLTDVIKVLLLLKSAVVTQ